MENQTATTTPVTGNTSFFFRDPTAAAINNNLRDGLPAPIKRAQVSVDLPLLTLQDVLDILTSTEEITANAKALIVDQVNAVLVAEVRSQIDDMPNYEEVDVSKIDMSTVDFIALSNTPKVVRSGGGISDELWAEFGDNFVEVITTVSETTADTANKVVVLLTRRLSSVSKQAAVLEKLETYLATWYGACTAEDQAKYEVVFARLAKRIEGYLDAVNDDPLAGLGI